MASRSHLSYAERAQKHSHPLVKRLFEVAHSKQSNITLSADVETTEELLKIANGKIERLCLNFPSSLTAPRYWLWERPRFAET